MPKEPKSRRRRLLDRLIRHYRLVIVNDDTLKTEASIKLNLLNVILLSCSLFVVFAAIILALIVLTPAKALIPGYQDSYDSRLKLIEYKRQTDSIMYRLQTEQQYYGNIMALLKDSLPQEVPVHRPVDTGSIPEVEPPGEDSLLRSEMEQMSAYGILTGQDRRQASVVEGMHFFAPLRGPITEGFAPSKSHYGIDVVAAEGTPVKAVMEGRVILAGWSSTDGYFVIVQHRENLTSVYKHNSALMVRTGQPVRAGDVLAIIGSSGEYARGVHLHFELWHNMKPVDPLMYITFT